MYNEPTYPIKKIIGWVLLGVFGITLLVLLLASTITIGTGKIAVLTRFGEVTGQELGEGFHWKFPFDKANEYDIKVLKEEAQATAASKDLQDANATVVLNYNLEAGKVSEIHRTVGIDYKAKLIDPAVQEVFKATTAKYDALQLITDRPGVKNEVQRALADRLDDYGIVVRDISITNFGFSPEFSKAIEAKQVAARNAERARFNLEQARLDAQAQEVQANTLSAEYLQLKAIEKWDGKMPQAIGGNGLLFNIPR